MESLKKWSENKDYESQLVVVETESGRKQSYFVTGQKDSCDHWEVAKMVGKVKYLMIAHNHWDGGYPSVADLWHVSGKRKGALMNLIVSPEGITELGLMPEYPVNLSGGLRDILSGKTNAEIVDNLQLWAAVEDYIQVNNPGIKSGEIAKKFCEMLGAAIKMFSWDKKETEELIRQ